MLLGCTYFFLNFYQVSSNEKVKEVFVFHIQHLCYLSLLNPHDYRMWLAEDCMRYNVTWLYHRQAVHKYYTLIKYLSLHKLLNQKEP